MVKNEPRSNFAPRVHQLGGSLLHTNTAKKRKGKAFPVARILVAAQLKCPHPGQFRPDSALVRVGLHHHTHRPNACGKSFHELGDP